MRSRANAQAYGSAEYICSFGYPAVNCRAIFIRPFGTGAWVAALDLGRTRISIKQRVEQGFDYRGQKMRRAAGAWVFLYRFPALPGWANVATHLRCWVWLR